MALPPARADGAPEAPFSFRPFTYVDLALAARWLQTPEVARWWGDAEEQLALLREDLAEPAMRQWIVQHGGQPFAYVQAYPVHAWPQPHLIDLPANAVAVDAFIGKPEMLGRGHGSAFLRRFAEMLIAGGAPVVATDPEVDNRRARRAYERAGFIEKRIAETGQVSVALMVFLRE